MNEVKDVLNNEELWYNPTKLFSYSRMLNFCMSNRGGGKTYSLKRFCLNSFIKKGHKFAWCRRFKGELRTAMRSFSADIQDEFPKNKITVKGNDIYVDGKLAGIGVALTQQTQIRGMNLGKEGIHTLVFDEFILGNSNLHYIQGHKEPEIFMEIVSTLFRHHDDLNRRVVCLANSISYVNPYFSFFGLRVPTEKQGTNCFIESHNKEVMLQIYSNEKHKDMMKATRFGTLVQGTTYGDYAIDNKSLMDNTNFIRYNMAIDKKSQFKFVCTFKLDGKEVNMWYSELDGIHFNNKCDRSSKEKIALTQSDFAVDYLRVKTCKSKWYYAFLKQLYEDNLVFYQTQEIEMLCREVFNILGIR